MALQAYRQVEVVVGPIRVSGHGLTKERNTVVTLAADGNALIVQNFGQRQNASHTVKGLFGPGVVAGKEQRKPAVEARLQRIGIAANHLCKGRRGLLVLLSVVILATQRHPRRAEIGAEQDGLIQVAQPLRLVGLRDAADVLLEGGKIEPLASGDKCLLGHAEAGVQLPGQLPCQRVEDADQVAHLTAGVHSLAHAQMRHVY